ncbi:MAG: rRNA-processing protein fcf1 [Marteilia pararefringens]
MSRSNSHKKGLKKMKSLKDDRYKDPFDKDKKKSEKAKKLEQQRKQNTKVSSAIFFDSNVALKPPYSILIDTNFIKFARQKKLEIYQESITALCGSVKLYVTECVFAELELMKEKSKLAME